MVPRDWGQKLKANYDYCDSGRYRRDYLGFPALLIMVAAGGAKDATASEAAIGRATRPGRSAPSGARSMTAIAATGCGWATVACRRVAGRSSTVADPQGIAALHPRPVRRSGPVSTRPVNVNVGDDVRSYPEAP